MLRKDLPIRSNLTDAIGGSSGSTITVYANPIVSKVRTNLLSESGGITVPEPLIESPWTPSLITTALWLDSSVSASVVKDGSNKVSQWLDLSGNDRHATQTISTRQPVYTTNALNSTPGIYFEGSNDYVPDSGDEYMEVAYSLLNNGSGSGGVFVVAQGSGTLQKGIIGTRETVTGNRGWILSYSDTTIRPLYANVGSGGGSVDTSGSSRSPDIIYLTKNGSNYFLKSFLNGENSASLGYTASITNKTFIGSSSEQLNETLTGYIYDIIVIENAIDSFTIDRINGYLAHKRGLTANLPSNHPYKNSAPVVLS